MRRLFEGDAYLMKAVIQANTVGIKEVRKQKYYRVEETTQKEMLSRYTNYYL